MFAYLLEVKQLVSLGTRVQTQAGSCTSVTSRFTTLPLCTKAHGSFLGCRLFSYTRFLAKAVPFIFRELQMLVFLVAMVCIICIPHLLESSCFE